MLAKLKSALDTFDARMKKKPLLFYFVTPTVGFVPFILYFFLKSFLGSFLPDFLYRLMFYVLVLPIFVGSCFLLFRVHKFLLSKRFY
jgi:hypothetical protein